MCFAYDASDLIRSIVVEFVSASLLFIPINIEFFSATDVGAGSSSSDAVLRWPPGDQV